MESKTVLITGIGGFFGGHLRQVLLTHYPDWHVVGLDRGPVADRGEVVVADLADRQALAALMASIAPDYVFHLAGVIYSSDWDQLFERNVRATINLLDATESCSQPPRVVIPGSAAEYGWVSTEQMPLKESEPLTPMSPYGVAKAWQTTVARSYLVKGCQVMIGRVFNVIGHGAPDRSSMGTFARQLRAIMREGAPPSIRVGNLKARRDFVDIADACRALVAIATTGTTGEIYNICSGRSVAMETLLTQMIEHVGVPVEVIVDPARLRAADVPDIYGSTEKIVRNTGWSPQVSLEACLRAMLGA